MTLSGFIKSVRIVLLPFLFLLTACADKVELHGNYYFPVKEFFTEKTDVFINQKDTTDKVYWKMKAYVLNSDTLMQTRIYDSKHGITDSTIEKISNGDAQAISYTLFDYPNGAPVKTNCEVLGNTLFKSDQKVGETIEWKISWNNRESMLSRSRKLISEDETNKIFSDELDLIDKDADRRAHYEATMVYQKGKGLVSYQLSLPGGIEKEYVLQNRK